MRYRYQEGQTVHHVVLERQGDGYRATVDGRTYEIEVMNNVPGAITLRSLTPEDPTDLLKPQVIHWAADGETRWLSHRGCTYRLDRPANRPRASGYGTGGGDTVRAPMPAQVRALLAAEGDTVAAGQTLLVLEAMKMEIKVTAPRAGTVVRLLAEQGATVERDQVLAELE